MSSIEDDLAVLRKRQTETEAELKRLRRRTRFGVVIVGLILSLLISPRLVVLLVGLGAIVLGGYAIVSFLAWVIDPAKDTGRSRHETAAGDRTSAGDPAGG